MDSSTGKDDDEVRGQLQLLRALMQNKSNLMYELSQLKIKTSYQQSNRSYREIKELITFSKIIKKKLEDLNLTHENFKNTESSDTPPETLTKLKSLVSYSQENYGQLENLLKEFDDSEGLLTLLKEKFELLSKEFQKKQAKLAENQMFLNEGSPEAMTFNELSAEIKEFHSELDFYKRENEKMKGKKENFKKNRRGSVQKVKLYKQFSENALKLRSQLLIREDLEKNIKNAEQELDYHSQQIEKEKARLEELEADLASNPNVDDLREELNSLEKEIQVLENELENYYREREELINPVVLGINLNERTNGTPEDSLTVSLASLIAGFTEMRMEKDNLIEQNNRLKERISSLFSAVV